MNCVQVKNSLKENQNKLQEGRICVYRNPTYFF